MKTQITSLALAALLLFAASPMCVAQRRPRASNPALANTTTTAPAETTADTTTEMPKQTPTPAPSFDMRPNNIQTGRSRDVTITVTNGKLTDYKLRDPSADSGITYDPEKARLGNDDTTLTFTASADEDADLGPVVVEIVKPAKGDIPADQRSFELEITEFKPRRISRGPTPGDMTAVDAMWNVLPYKVTKANYGRRAADAFYAIEVIIGNNSGFDLQIVGVGFDTAFGARTTNRDGRPLEFLKDESGKPVQDEYGNRFIEAVDNNGNYILNGDGQRTYRTLRKYQLATSDHRLVRGTIEKDQMYGSRALTMNIIGGFGTFLSGFIPFYRNANPKANFSTFSSIVNGQFKEGFGLAAPDLTVNQLNRLENTVLHEGLTVLNNTQERTIVFFPRHIVGVTVEERKKQIDQGDMRPVLEKLGELIIVGKPFISFANREVVATKNPDAITRAPTPTRDTAAEAPTITGFRATGGNAPASSITISGSNFSGTTSVTVGGVAARVTAVTDNQLTVEVPENAVSGPISVTTPGGRVDSTQRFSAQPRITGFKPEPDNSPGSTMVISGLNLEGVTSVLFGTKESNVFIGTKTPTEIRVAIPQNAVTGPLTVQSPNGNHTSTNVFKAVPVINDITRTAGRGEEVVITGINLDNTVDVKFGNVSAEEITEKLKDKVTVKVPSNPVNGQITVETFNGNKAKSGADKTFTLIERPTATGIAVGSGQPVATASAAVGTTIHIHGTNLKTVKEVKFEGTDPLKTFTDPAPTDEKITVQVPTGAKTGTIKVKTKGGEVTTGQLTITPTSPP